MEQNWNDRSGPSTALAGSSQSMRIRSSQATPGKRARSPNGTQEDEDEKEDSPPPELDEHYVTTRTDVVGVQYYRGMVGRGEYVMLRREPNNAYDPNAVQVMNASNVQVGHIPRFVASKLAYLMDTKLITVEGRMVGQNLDHAKHYKMAMDMSIYARPSHREALEPELEWATPGGLGFEHMRRLESQGANTGTATGVTGSQRRTKGKGRVLGGDTGIGGGGVGTGGNDEDMRRLLDGLKRVGEDEKQADGVMDALTADIDVTKLPLHPSPPGLENGQLLVDLLPHQSQALQWMISRENPKLPKTPADPAVQFWTKQEDKKSKTQYWLNVATRTPQSETPVLGKGGIIADGMGLGKTLTALSLVLATKKDKPVDGFSNSTLIVCPLSVLSNWEKQIKDHVTMGNITVYTYHGANKGVTANTLKEYDVVLTTYQTIAAEASPDSLEASQSKGKKVKTTGGGPLSKVQWKRVVADEGHVLKNPKAKMTQSFAALSANCRWICTGTPIVNSPADLGSLLTCLQLCKPLDQSAYFRSLLLRPLKNGDPTAGKLLQALVGQILLRRTKDSKDRDGKRLVELPPIEYFQVPVSLDAETRKVYEEIQEASRKRLEDALRTGENTANVLSMLTRTLVPQSYLDDIRRPISVDAGTGPSIAVVNISPEKRRELVDKLRQIVADNEECSVCFDTFNDPRITDCGHAFCNFCISTVIDVHKKCPMCRHSITQASLLDLPPPPTNPDDDDDFNDTEDNSKVKVVKSAKILELIKYLRAFKTDEKTLVFSQFTGFLDHVASALRDEGIGFCRFDGSMNAKKRQEVIQLFQTPVSAKHDKYNPRVMLISLKSGAVGLNLTAASNVFLCDPWWQSAIEAQAIDRAHRLGQKKTVRVFQLIAEDTIESKVLDIQKRKDALVAKAFEKSSKETKQEKKQARFEELKEIFGLR